MKIYLATLFIVFCGVLTGTNTFGQASLTAVGTSYTQNFDGLGTTSFNLTDNTSILGVYAFRAAGNATPNVFTLDNGGSNAGSFRNYGTTAANDRSLGSLGSGGTATLNYGVRLVNNTGTTINSISVSYSGEQWRNGGNATAQTLAFDYLQAPTVTDLTTGTYTPVTALNFVTPINTATAAALDGNAAANRATLTAVIGVTIPVGEEIMLRWTDINDAGNDHGLAIDDLSVTPSITTAAGAVISGRVLTADGRGIQNARLMISGNGLREPMYVTTSAFGYYRFNEVPAGETYVVSVTAKRYIFDNAARVISLTQDLTAADFTANK